LSRSILEPSHSFLDKSICPKFNQSYAGLAVATLSSPVERSSLVAILAVAQKKCCLGSFISTYPSHRCTNRRRRRGQAIDKMDQEGSYRFVESERRATLTRMSIARSMVRSKIFPISSVRPFSAASWSPMSIWSPTIFLSLWRSSWIEPTDLRPSFPDSGHRRVR